MKTQIDLDMRLLTERLVLRTPDEGDAGDIFRIMSDEKLSDRTGFKRMSDMSEAIGKIRGILPEESMFVISEKEHEDRAAGVLEMKKYRTCMENRVVTKYALCYFLEASAQGKGYMTECVDRIREFLFNDCDADVIVIYIEPDNPKSRNVALKCGFKLKKSEKGCAIAWNGRLMDLESYELAKDDKTDNIIMEKQKWINDGGILYPIPGAATLLETPGHGVFRIHEDARTGRLGLDRMDESFSFSFKVYDTGCEAMLDKILKTWDSSIFTGSGKNLGVIFNGLKGTGKTIAAKILCNRTGLPTIVISKVFDGMLEFIQSLNFEAAILIDEAEKTFDDNREMLLKMIDGVYNSSRKLYILTTNKLNLDENLLGRPGRIRYIHDFGNLPEAVIEQVIDDNLAEKHLRSSILKLVDRLEISTIDILKSIVEECNITGELPDEKSFNIPMAKCKNIVVSFDDLAESRFDDVKDFVLANKPASDNIEKWIYADSGTGKTWKSVIDDKFECSISCETLSGPTQIPHPGQRHGNVNVLTELDSNGFFIGESVWGSDPEPELFCLARSLGTPSIYRGILKW